MQDLLATFIPKFVAIATTRVARAIELAMQRTVDLSPAIARELHSIAGEAGLLGIGPVVKLARVCEGHAKRFRASGSDADADAVLAGLTELKSAIGLVIPPPDRTHE